MNKKLLRRTRRQRTSQPTKMKGKYCQLGQFLCLGQFPDSTLKWCEICDDHSFGTGMHRYESCKGETCQEVYGRGNGCRVGRFLCLGQNFLRGPDKSWCKLCLKHWMDWDGSLPCQGRTCQYDTHTGDIPLHLQGKARYSLTVIPL